MAAFKIPLRRPFIFSRPFFPGRVHSWVRVFVLSAAYAFTAQAAPYTPLPGDAALEQALLTLTNEARAAAGVGQLEPNPELAQAARHHAAEMAQLGYFSHTSPVAANATLEQRVASSGSFVRTLGENLALVGVADTAQATTTGWLESPGHRANLLNPRFTHVGFGSAPYPDGRVAVAQVLGYEPATLLEAQLVSVLAEKALLNATVSLAAAGEVALFYAQDSSPPQSLEAGQHTLSVPIAEAPTRPLPVQLGLRSGGAGGGFILQDDGWLTASGWERSGAVSGAQAQLLNVTVQRQTERGLELRLTFATPPPTPLGAWQGETLLPLQIDETTVTVGLTETGAQPVYIGEAQADGRYAVVYSLQPDHGGSLRVLPTTE